MSQNFPWRFPWTIGRSQAHLDAFYNARPTVMGRIWRSLETGPQGAVCQNYQAQNQIFKSKYKEWELGAELRNQSILFYRLMILSCCLQNYWNLDIERKQQKISGVVFQRAFPETGPRSEVELLTTLSVRLHCLETTRLTNLDFCPWLKSIQTMQKHSSLEKDKNKQKNNNLRNRQSVILGMLML